MNLIRLNNSKMVTILLLIVISLLVFLIIYIDCNHFLFYKVYYSVQYAILQYFLIYASNGTVHLPMELNN
jgi:hypothetical protein